MGSDLKVRLEQDKVCLPCDLGAPDGRKDLVALADGFRESSLSWVDLLRSWADLLRPCRRRGMTTPELAVGVGTLGFSKALQEVFPDAREQRCWFHVSSNVLAALPKSAHPRAKAALAGIHNAEDSRAAQRASGGSPASDRTSFPQDFLPRFARSNLVGKSPENRGKLMLSGVQGGESLDCRTSEVMVLRIMPTCWLS
jgi:hypothetical protein